MESTKSECPNKPSHFHPYQSSLSIFILLFLPSILLPHQSSDQLLPRSPNAGNEEPFLNEDPSPPLRPLTSLKWPYIPEESAYPDPLKRDDPKALQLHQYEAIATSSAVRTALGDNLQLHDLLRSLDKLRGDERQDAIQSALGVSTADVKPPGIIAPEQNREDVQALRRLAEAIEAAVRGGKQDVLGLDWGDGSLPES